MCENNVSGQTTGQNWNSFHWKAMSLKYRHAYMFVCVTRLTFPPVLPRVDCTASSTAQLLEHKIAISVYFQQISLCLLRAQCRSISSVPFSSSLSSLEAWHFTVLSGDSCTKWSCWESTTVNSRRPHVMCLKHRWTVLVWRKKIEVRERGRGWIDNRIILCFVWGGVSKQ